MLILHSCIICHKPDVHWHHIVKRKEPILRVDGNVRALPNRPPDVPLCPRHHKLADLGKIPASELWRLKEEGNIIEKVINGDMIWEFQPWEAEYHRSESFDGMHDFGETMFFADGFLALSDRSTMAQHQIKRIKRVSVWLCSSSQSGTYLFKDQMFSYLKKSP